MTDDKRGDPEAAPPTPTPAIASQSAARSAVSSEEHPGAANDESRNGMTQAEELLGGGVNRAASSTPERRLERGLITLARWTLRLMVLAAGFWGLMWLLGALWSILLPLLLGLLLSTVLWPPARWLRRFLPNALAALLVVLGLLGVVAGLIALLAPGVTSQAEDLAEQASAGLQSLQQWLTGPPFNLEGNTVGDLISRGIETLQNNSSTVVRVVLTSLGAFGSAVITLVLALVLAFFFLKDGPKFLGWLNRWTSERTASHVERLFGRIWTALGQFVWSQSAVALVDALFIGLGVWILGVPFALPIAVLTFFGGFVPIVGAFVAGAIAVLVALVSNGPWVALGVLGIVVAVQQIEGNVLQPVLVGRTMEIHPALVLVVVALGGTLFGVVGAFLAVPAIAVVQVSARYVREQIGAAPPGTEKGRADK